MSKKDDLLDNLFDVLLEQLLTRVKEGSAKPADLECARKFLADNGIDATAQAKPAMLDLSRLTPTGAAFSGPDDTLQ